MSQRNKVYFIITTLAIVFISVLFYYFTSNQTSEKNDLQYETSFSAEESIVYLGNDSLKNEVLFIFDYSCVWCSRWMIEIFPSINKLIEEDTLKFRTQSMVFLNDASLQLSKLDQNIKQHYPDKYFDIYSQIIDDGHDEDYEQLLAQGYIEELISFYQLDSDLLLAETEIDVIHVTRKYTKELDVESVPTVIVNGINVDDPFSLEAIEKLLK